MTTDTSVDVMAVLDVIDHCAKIIGETGYPHSEAALNKAREAIRELVEADRELNDCGITATVIEGWKALLPAEFHSDANAIIAALSKQAAALQKFAGV